MTTLNRLILDWAGGPVVGRAVTVLHFSASDNTAPPVAAVKAALEAASAAIPATVTITVPGVGDKIEDTTGTLTGVWSSGGGGTVTGTGPTTSAAGVGACIGWQTGGIINGRKLRGRTFIVPLPTDAYDTTGTLQTTYLNVLGTLANSLQAAGPLAVWHRPTTVGGTDGNSYGVVSNRIRDKVAFLSSRRD